MDRLIGRRGFFGTLAALAVAPFSAPAVLKRRIWRCTSIRSHKILNTLTADGGYLIPKELEPALQSTRLIYGRDYFPCEHPTITLRTLDGKTITREIPHG